MGMFGFSIAFDWKVFQVMITVWLEISQISQNHQHLGVFTVPLWLSFLAQSFLLALSWADSPPNFAPHDCQWHISGRIRCGIRKRNLPSLAIWSTNPWRQSNSLDSLKLHAWPEPKLQNEVIQLQWNWEGMTGTISLDTTALCQLMISAEKLKTKTSWRYIFIHLSISAIFTVVQQCINASVLSLDIFPHLQQKRQKSGLWRVWTSRETTLTSTTSDAFVFTRRHHVSQDKGVTTLTRRIWLFHQVFTLTSVAIFKHLVYAEFSNINMYISQFQNDNDKIRRCHGPLASPAAGECHPAQSTV